MLKQTVKGHQRFHSKRLSNTSGFSLRQNATKKSGSWTEGGRGPTRTVIQGKKRQQPVLDLSGLDHGKGKRRRAPSHRRREPDECHEPQLQRTRGHYFLASSPGALAMPRVASRTPSASRFPVESAVLALTRARDDGSKDHTRNGPPAWPRPWAPSSPVRRAWGLLVRAPTRPTPGCPRRVGLTWRFAVGVAHCWLPSW
jgi:hypothetical protein